MVLASSLIGLTACGGGGGGGAVGTVSNFINDDISSLSGSANIISNSNSLISNFNSIVYCFFWKSNEKNFNKLS